MRVCRACTTQYHATDDDGFKYFHVCPPLSPTELVALVAGLDLATAQTFTNIERPGHRDENVRVNDRGDVVLIAEGAGVDDIADAIAVSVRTVADVAAFVKKRAGAILAFGPLL